MRPGSHKRVDVNVKVAVKLRMVATDGMAMVVR